MVVMNRHRYLMIYSLFDIYIGCIYSDCTVNMNRYELREQ